MSAGSPAGRPLLIAIVDDEPSVRVSLRRLCQALGFSATVYASGPEFIASLAPGALRPDCVLLDAHMPEMSGLEVQQQLAGAGVRIPTIVFTGDDVPDVQTLYRAVGVTEYFRKPIGGEALLAAIGRVVGAGGAGGAPPGGS